MKTVALEDIRMSVADWLDQENSDTVLITRGGEPIAFLSPVDSLDLEAAALKDNPQFWEIIEHSRKRDKLEGSLTIAEVCAELGIPIEDVCPPTAPEVGAH